MVIDNLRAKVCGSSRYPELNYPVHSAVNQSSTCANVSTYCRLPSWKISIKKRIACQYKTRKVLALVPWLEHALKTQVSSLSRVCLLLVWPEEQWQPNHLPCAPMQNTTCQACTLVARQINATSSIPNPHTPSFLLNNSEDTLIKDSTELAFLLRKMLPRGDSPEARLSSCSTRRKKKRAQSRNTHTVRHSVRFSTADARLDIYLFRD